MLGAEPPRPGLLLAALELRTSLFGEGEKEVSVPVPHAVAPGRVLEALERVLAESLQHPEPRSGLSDKALGDEGLERVEVRVADGPGRIERPAAREHGKPGEELPPAGTKEVIAPVHGGSQGPLPGGEVTRPRGEQVQAPAKPLQHLCRCQHLHPCCGKLEGQGQAVELAADLGDGIVGLEVSLQRPRPLGKQGDGLGLRQRRDGIAPLAGQLQRFAAGDQELDRGSRSQEPGQTGCCLHDLLDVVQDQERLPGGEAKPRS